MTILLARDAVASGHLVYAWPFPIGEDCEVSCGADEQVVMSPAWTVGDRLGPGRHVWRSPDPMRPAGAFFVRTVPVEVTFDMTTRFVVPSTGQPVRLRAAGSLQVRCADPGLLIAQFVGLPFDTVNDGILRSVSRSVERMLARLLTRRVVMGASPGAVTEPGMLPGILEELVAYNPTAGAVFGIELIRMGHLVIAADDGSALFLAIPNLPGVCKPVDPDISLVETARGRPRTLPPEVVRSKKDTARHASVPPAGTPERQRSVSGEISVPSVAVSRAADEITQPGVAAPEPGSMQIGTPPPTPMPAAGSSPTVAPPAQGTIPGENPVEVARGSRVRVPGPNGLMQSATVRQLLQGYYELEVGSSGETIWVPQTGVVPE